MYMIRGSDAGQSIHTVEGNTGADEVHAGQAHGTGWEQPGTRANTITSSTTNEELVDIVSYEI